MRAASFPALRDLAGLVLQHRRGLRATQIDGLVYQQQLIRTLRGEMPARTTLYHYRNILLHLRILRRNRYLYTVNTDDPLVVELLNVLRFGTPALSEDERRLFAELVVRNPDCQKYFFSLFVTDGEIGSLSHFIDRGRPVAWKTLSCHGGRQVLLKNLESGKQLLLLTKDQFEAILYGVRYWARDELLMIDELFWEHLGNVMFPIDASRQIRESELVQLLLRNLDMQADWTTFSIRDLAYRWCSSLKVPIKKLHEILRATHRKYPEYVVFIPIPQGLATLTAESRAQEEHQLRSYVQDDRGRYISHIRVHARLKEVYECQTSSV